MHGKIPSTFSAMQKHTIDKIINSCQTTEQLITARDFCKDLYTRGEIDLESYYGFIRRMYNIVKGDCDGSAFTYR